MVVVVVVVVIVVVVLLSLFCHRSAPFQACSPHARDQNPKRALGGPG